MDKGSHTDVAVFIFDLRVCVLPLQYLSLFVVVFCCFRRSMMSLTIKRFAVSIFKRHVSFLFQLLDFGL